jgi:hypothetical protein
VTASTFARVIPVRPRLVPVLAPRPRPATRPVPVLAARRPRPAVPVVGGLVAVEWDEFRGVYVAVCDRCCESLDALHLDQAHEWAEGHCCDPELAALLAEVLDRRAA